MVTTEDILAELRKLAEPVSETGVTLQEIATASGISIPTANRRMRKWLAADTWRMVRVLRRDATGTLRPKPGYEPIRRVKPPLDLPPIKPTKNTTAMR